MKKFLLALPLILGSFALTNCDNRRPEPPPSVTTTTTTTSTPMGTLAKTEVAASVGGATIGVAECDVFITKYEKCILDKVPEAVRGSLKDQLGKSRDTWVKVAATPEGKLSLPGICTASLNAAKQSMSAYGCEF